MVLKAFDDNKVGRESNQGKFKVWSDEEG